MPSSSGRTGSDLQSFITELRAARQLHEIDVPTDPDLEVTEIADRWSKARDSKALLFRRPKGSEFPLAVNLFGSAARIRLALGGRSPAEVGAALAAIVRMEMPVDLSSSLKALGTLKDLMAFPPRKVRTGISQEVVHEGKEVDLLALPHLKCWPKDGGRFITFPLVFTHDPETGERNVGVYRMQVFDRTTTAMHWQIHKHGARHHWKAEQKGKRLEVAVALGGDPGLMFSAVAPLPDPLDELLLAGFIRGSGIRLVPGRTVDILVPADAEFVLEGYVEPGERRTEGPFGDHFGTYCAPEPFPVFHVTAITRREHPVYPAILVGRPPMEDGLLGKAITEMFLPLIRLQYPEVEDLELPIASGFHNLAMATVRGRFPRHASKVILGLWGLGQMMLSKCIAVFDPGTDLRDGQAVLASLLRNVDWNQDLIFVREGIADQLDVGSPWENIGSKLGIDATGGGEFAWQAPPQPPDLAEAVRAIPAVRHWHVPVPGLLLLGIEKSRPHQAREAVHQLWQAAGQAAASACYPRLAWVFDAFVPIEDSEAVLWAGLNNLDPVRDLFFERSVEDLPGTPLPRLSGRLGIDSTAKREEEGYHRDWPEVALMDPGVIALVDRRWTEYGFSGKPLPSPSRSFQG